MNDAKHTPVIQFRLFDHENDKFVSYGYEFSLSGFDYRHWCVRSDGACGWVSKYGYILDGGRKFTVTLSTGILDANKKPIYVGDHLKDLLSGAIWEVRFGHCKKFGFTGFYCYGINVDGRESQINADPDSDTNSQVEIIGNVFQSAINN